MGSDQEFILADGIVVGGSWWEQEINPGLKKKKEGKKLETRRGQPGGNVLKECSEGGVSQR